MLAEQAGVSRAYELVKSPAETAQLNNSLLERRSIGMNWRYQLDDKAAPSLSLWYDLGWDADRFVSRAD